jgi:quercetin dioxygenase-like cupin family protein
MRKHILVIAALVTGIAAVAGGGIAIASHVTEVDPAAVPVGFLAAHNRVADVPVSAFARAAAADGAEVTVQHIRLVPNQPIPWHTHPGPGIALIERGSFTYEAAQGSKCVRTTYEAGEGFVDPGFGNVHQATAGPAGAEIYVIYVLPPGSANQLIPTAPDPACTS